MRRMKKYISLLLVVCMCCSLFAACGNENAVKGKRRAAGKVTNTPTPTAEPTGTPLPTEIVTPTPTVAAPKVTPAFGKPEYTEEQQAFNAFLDEVFIEFLGEDSFSAHFIAENPETFGMNAGGSLGDAVQDEEEFYVLCKNLSDKMDAFSYDSLTEGQKVNYDRLRYEFELGIQNVEYNTDAYCGLFSLNGNTVTNLFTMINEYPILNKEDAESFLEIMDDLPRYLRESMTEARRAYVEADCVLLTSMLDNTKENLEGFLYKDGQTDYPMLAAFERNLAEANLSEEEKSAYMDELKAKLLNGLNPALEQMIKDVEALYSYCDEPAGMCTKEGGKEYFEYLAQSELGVDMSAEEMYAYLKGKFDAEYRELVKLLTFHADSYENYPYDGYTESDPEAILESLKQYIKDNYPLIPDTDYMVSELPEALRVDGILAYYLSPQVDVPERNVIRFNPDGISDCASFFSTLAHEGYPGHLYQNAYFAECEGNHALDALLSYVGYQEGWAVIAGQQAYHYIIDDPNLADLYAYDYNLGMALCSIAEIGVNSLGWDEEDLRNEFDAYGYGEIVGEVIEITVSDPTIYLPYSVGRYLMQDTMDALKAQGYTDIEAKTAILNVGPCTFEVLWKHLGIDGEQIKGTR